MFVFLSLLTSCFAGKVDEMLEKMTLEEKVGQMTQIDVSAMMLGPNAEINEEMASYWLQDLRIGSVLNSPFSTADRYPNKVSWTASEFRTEVYKIQKLAVDGGNIPVIYGLDSVHGAIYVYDATIFPQQIAMASTFNSSVAEIAGRIAAKDTRAAGVPWLFAPILDICTMPLWSRVFETFGEDPYLASRMGESIVKGMQTEFDDGASPPRAAACMKHFVGYPLPQTGHDRSPSIIADRTLFQLYTQSFRAAVDAGIKTAMESYNEISGVPVVSSSDYLKKLLRFDMEFDGMLVTDYAEIENLHNWHMVSPSINDGIQLAMVDTSIDMSMVALDPSFTLGLAQLVRDGLVDESRLDESVRRILTLKQDLGLLDDDYINQFDVNDPILETVGQASDWNEALEISRQSVILLKNDDHTLPLSLTAGGSIFVTGQGCDSLTYQTGGWTYHWQGAVDDAEFTRGQTMLDGMMAIAQERGIDVSYYAGVDVNAINDGDVNYDDVLSLLSSSNVVVACFGESNYAEKPGDIDDLTLPAGQLDYAKRLATEASARGIPMISVLVEGRPRLLGDIPSYSKAIVHALLQGPEGGTAVSEVLFGLVNPSGRLPYTYPKHAGDIPLPYHRKPSSKCTNPDNGFEYIDCDVEWWFGHGLSYTSFEYSNLQLSSSSMSWDGGDDDPAITASVSVTNTGSMAGTDVVMLFVSDVYRRVTPEMKLLKGFQRVALAVGETRAVSFDVSVSDLGYYGLDSRLVYEDGEFRVGIGSNTDCRDKDWADDDMCASFEFTTSPQYNPICKTSCGLLINAGYFNSRQACTDKCLHDSNDGTKAWTWDLVTCMENAIIAGQTSILSACRDVTLDSSKGTSGGVSTSKAETYAISMGVGIAGVAIGVLFGALWARKKKSTKFGYAKLDVDSSSELN